MRILIFPFFMIFVFCGASSLTTIAQSTPKYDYSGQEIIIPITRNDASGHELHSFWYSDLYSETFPTAKYGSDSGWKKPYSKSTHIEWNVQERFIKVDGERFHLTGETETEPYDDENDLETLAFFGYDSNNNPVMIQYIGFMKPGLEHMGCIRVIRAEIGKCYYIKHIDIPKKGYEKLEK